MVAISSDCGEECNGGDVRNLDGSTPGPYPEDAEETGHQDINGSGKGKRKGGDKGGGKGGKDKGGGGKGKGGGGGKGKGGKDKGGGGKGKKGGGGGGKGKDCGELTEQHDAGEPVGMCPDCHEAGELLLLLHKTGSVGNLLGQRPPQHSRDFKRDNVKMVRTMSRDVLTRRRESEKSADPDFKLRQFANVASRLHQAPQRLQATASTPAKQRSLSIGFSPAKTSPGQSPWARGPLRSCNQPVTKPRLDRAEAGKRESLKGKENRPGARLLFSPPPRTEASSEQLSVSRCEDGDSDCSAPGWWPASDRLASEFFQSGRLR
ncbi:unnamed protein product [Effrenium voratum]|uniref:Uncharacterized protein n=1 Tax=Effrenium voratum TaxID=2562239 RepID=A0AA36ISS1_9DINO|nr:unnamed protein product [Effrenium voratum]